MKVRDSPLVPVLLEELRRKTESLSEQQVTQVLRGMSQCNHQDDEFLKSLMPAIKKNMGTYSMVGVSTVLSMYSRASVFDEQFYRGLINAQLNQLHKMQSVSLQHLMTVFARYFCQSSITVFDVQNLKS